MKKGLPYGNPFFLADMRRSLGGVECLVERGEGLGNLVELDSDTQLTADLLGGEQPAHDLAVTGSALDDKGVVQGFRPIHVTKFGNEVWSGEDARYTESRLKGRPTEQLTFHGEIDAVTSATMSSTLIFDEARRAGEAVRKLR